MIPYVTQIGPDGSGHDRCGAACAASVLLSAGWDSDPWGLLLQLSHELWGDAEPRGVGSAALLDLLAKSEYGFRGDTWYLWPQAVNALDRGRSVLCLLDNWLLVPRPYPPGPSWNALHWVRLVQLIDGGEMAYVYDPLCYLPTGGAAPYQGPTVCTVESLRAAIAASPVEEAGIVVWREGA